MQYAYNKSFRYCIIVKINVYSNYNIYIVKKGAKDMNMIDTWLHIVIRQPELCIGCRKCEKNCPVGAVTVENKRPDINTNVCISCGMCVVQCPKKVIQEADGAL